MWRYPTESRWRCGRQRPGFAAGAEGRGGYTGYPADYFLCCDRGKSIGIFEADTCVKSDSSAEKERCGETSGMGIKAV